jgi:hypothetical protein
MPQHIFRLYLKPHNFRAPSSFFSQSLASRPMYCHFFFLIKVEMNLSLKENTKATINSTTKCFQTNMTININDIPPTKK